MGKITKKQFKTAIKGSGGVITIIAHILEKSRKAIYDFMGKNPEFKDLIEEEAERPIDLAETVLHRKLRNEDMDAVKLILLNSKRGRARGYGVKQEINASISTNKPISINIIKPEEDEEDKLPANN